MGLSPPSPPPSWRTQLLSVHPDTDLMVQYLHGFTEEFTKLPNVPALAEGNAIQQLTTQMNAQFAQVNAQFAQVNAQMNAQFAQINAQFAQVNAQFAQRFDRLITKLTRSLLESPQMI